MSIHDASGGRLVLGQDVFCAEFGKIGQLMGMQLAAQRCWVRLRDGVLVTVQAAQVKIASWAQISRKA